MKTYLLIWSGIKTNHVDSLMRMRGLDATMLFNKCEQDSLHAKQKGIVIIFFLFSQESFHAQEEVDPCDKTKAGSA